MVVPHSLEHRLGGRFIVSTPTRLLSGRSELAALIVDASASGAFILGNFCLPRWSVIQVQVDSERIAAWVVRVTAEGIGVEWWDFAPPAVLARIRNESAGRGSVRKMLPAAEPTGVIAESA